MNKKILLLMIIVVIPLVIATRYDWIMGEPVISTTRYDWIMGEPYVVIEIEAGGEPPVGGNDTCSCPVSPANWFINMPDHCNITSACNNAGFNLTFTNGTTTDTINISSTIICDNINFNTTGYVFIDSDGYLNLT